MSSRSGFRADVQGLRAIAVLTVIAGHAGLPYVDGGFVGVDVFFVISGFLISSLLFREVDRSGTVSLSGFYARRARRILPAAALVTVVTLVASTIWLSLLDARSIVYDALFSALFVANYRFAWVETDYFAQTAPPSPLQHYWSLAVEEQFYLVWPLLLLACLVLARRRGGSGLPRRTVAVVLAVVSAASLAASVLRTPDDPAGVYFSTLDRAWELGLGALCAVVAPWVGRRLTRARRDVLVLGGLVAVAVACTTYSSATLFPGYAALLPVLGAAAMLLGGAGDDATSSPVVRALGVRPMRVVGDWSYSLYLWHWPALILPRTYLDRDLTGVETAGVLVAVAVLSWATYRWVETPFREARRLTMPRALWLYPISLVVVGATAAGSWAWTSAEVAARGDRPAISVTDYGQPDGARPERFDPDPTVALVQASVRAAENGVAVPGRLQPDLLELLQDNPDVSDCDYDADSRDLCPRGDADGERTMVVLGDSHGRMWVPAIESYAADHGWTVYFLVKPHCTAAYVTTDHNGDGRPWAGCTDFRDWARDQMATLQPDLTVVATGLFASELYVDGDAAPPVTSDDDVVAASGPAFADLFTAATEVSGRVVLLRDIPTIDEDPARCLSQGDPDLGDCLFTGRDRPRRIADASVEAARAAGIDVVDPTPWVCFEDKCPAVIGDTINYRDISHISATRAGELADVLGRALRMG